MATVVMCSTCNKRINGEFLRLNDGTFHTECVTCEKCCAPLDVDKFRAIDGKFLCTTCAPWDTCHGCSQPIIGEKATCDKHTFHRGCFTCGSCGCGLVGAPGIFKTEALGYVCGTCFDKPFPKAKTVVANGADDLEQVGCLPPAAQPAVPASVPQETPVAKPALPASVPQETPVEPAVPVSVPQETPVGDISVIAVRKMEINLAQDANAKRWFNEKDLNRDGGLSIHEIAKALKGCGMAFHSEWDVNGDGKVSLEEFMSSKGMRDMILQHVRSQLVH